MAELVLFTRDGGSDINGGSDDTDAAKATYANVDASANGGGNYDLDNNNGGSGWGTSGDGDWICYDTATNVEFAIITDISKGGGDADVIEVQTIDDGVLTVTIGVNVNVGGAFATPDHAWSVNQTYSGANAVDGTANVVGVEGDATYNTSAAILYSMHGTNKRTLVLRAMPGFTVRPIITRAGLVVNVAGYDYTEFRDLHLKKTGAGAGYVVEQFIGTDAYYKNCHFEATGGSTALMHFVQRSTFVDCTFTQGGTGQHLLFTGDDSCFINCDFNGGDGSDFTDAQGVFINCKLNGAKLFIDGVTRLVNCNFEAGAGLDGVGIDVSTTGHVVMVDSIVQDSGGYGVNADETNYLTFYGNNNLWYNNTSGHRNNVPNYGGGDDVEDSNPNLDANDIPNPSSPAIGAGSTTNGNIGRRESAVGGGAGGTALSRVRIGM